MTTTSTGCLRTATAHDGEALLRLWERLFDDASRQEPWGQYAAEWFARFVEEPGYARFPVIEVDGAIVATAVGTLELGVPNPQCTKGRAVRIANVITLAEHRGQGYGTALVLDLLSWARSIDADRVDLSATAEGKQLYERLGFTLTAAPRMKFVL